MNLTLIAACSFPPGNPPANAYMRNCYGVGSVPGRDGVGRYYVSVPAGNGIEDTNFSNIKVEVRAWNAANDVRLASCSVAQGLNGIVNFGFAINALSGAALPVVFVPTDDFVRFEFVLYRLPVQ